MPDQLVTSTSVRQSTQERARGADRLAWNKGHTASPELTAHYQGLPTRAVVFPDQQAQWAQLNGVSLTVYINPDDPFEPVDIPEPFADVFESSRAIDRDVERRSRQGITQKAY